MRITRKAGEGARTHLLAVTRGGVGHVLAVRWHLGRRVVVAPTVPDAGDESVISVIVVDGTGSMAHARLARAGRA